MAQGSTGEMELVSQYADLAAAALDAAILGVLLYALFRIDRRASAPFIGVILFVALRGASLANESPHLRPGQSAQVEAVIDVATVVVLAYLLTQSRRLVRLLRATYDEAQYRAEEYDRAARHYTQLVRHRLLNPLTVIKGAALTLRDVQTDPQTRSELCDAIVTASDEIESVTFEPARRDAVEAELDATPNLDDRSLRPPR